MAGTPKPRKVVDEVHQLRCSSGSRGVLCEEVYVDASNRIVKYNLAFIHHQLCTADNGRVLGYDNAHGYHERHWMGEASRVSFNSYEVTLELFLNEVAELKLQS